MKTRVASAGLLNLHYFMRATFLRHKNEWLIIVDDNNFFFADCDKIQALSRISLLAVKIHFRCIVKFHLEFDTFLRWLTKIFPFDGFTLKKFLRRFSLSEKLVRSSLRSNYELNFWLMVEKWSGLLKKRFLEPLCGFSTNFGGRCFFFLSGHQFPFILFCSLSCLDEIAFHDNTKFEF